jgi:hypothetical protein
MNTTDLIERVEEEFDSKSVAIIGVGLVALGFLLTLRKRMSRDVEEGELPPIIIKSGSFVVESDVDLYQPPQSPNTYKRRGFGEIRGVRVFVTNEITGRAKSYDFDDRNGIEVDIRLQKHTPSGWIDINPLVTIRSETNSGTTKDFVLTIGKKISKKGHPKPGRRYRYVDDDSDNIRFGQIVVRENDGGGMPFVSKDSEDYIIAFYNYLI